MARKELFHPSDATARKSTNRHKDFSKPLFDAAALRAIGRAYDRGIIKEKAHGK